MELATRMICGHCATEQVNARRAHAGRTQGRPRTMRVVFPYRDNLFSGGLEEKAFIHGVWRPWWLIDLRTLYISIWSQPCYFVQ